MNEHFNDYQNLLVEELKKDRELAVIYLKGSSLEEDPRMLFIALRDVIQAYSSQNEQPNGLIVDESEVEFRTIKSLFPKLKLSLQIEQEHAEAQVCAS